MSKYTEVGREGYDPIDPTSGRHWTPDNPDAPARLVGRKTGRVAPRDHIRPPAREATQVAHGLKDIGDLDPNHGQLFDKTEIPQIPLSEIAAERGLPEPQAKNQGGFLPQIGSRGNGRSAWKRKVSAIEAHAKQYRSVPGQENEPAPQAASMRRLQESYQNRPQEHDDVDWYSSIKQPETIGEQKKVEPGLATRMIEDVSRSQNVGFSDVSRGVAEISPKNNWVTGDRQNRNFPNLGDVREISRRVNHPEFKESGIEIPDRSVPFKEQMSGRFADLMSGRVGPFEGTAVQGGIDTFAPKVARSVGGMSDQKDRGRPEVADEEVSMKSIDFNESLHVGQRSVPRSLKAAYSGSYTNDVHDQRAQGQIEPLGEMVDKQPYAVGSQIGQRAANKARDLPPHFQSGVWERQRAVTNDVPLGPLLSEKTILPDDPLAGEERTVLRARNFRDK